MIKKLPGRRSYGGLNRIGRAASGQILKVAWPEILEGYPGAGNNPLKSSYHF